MKKSVLFWLCCGFLILSTSSGWAFEYNYTPGYNSLNNNGLNNEPSGSPLFMTNNNDGVPLTIKHLIGDNDGYGYGAGYVGDGADLPHTDNPAAGYGWRFDNRSALEMMATDGSQATDMEDFSDVTFHHSFDLSQFESMTEAFFTIDISGLQQNMFGGYSRLYFDGVEATDFLNINQGTWGSGIFGYAVDLSMLADGRLDVYFDNWAGDFGDDDLAVDFTMLTVSGYASSAVPEPGTMLLVGLGLAGLGLYRRNH